MTVEVDNSIFQNISPDQIEIENPPTSLPGRKNLRISLTPKCNLACSHCHNEGQPPPWANREELKKYEVSIDSIGQLIAIASQFGVKSIKFTGGDPGVYKPFDQLLSTISESWQEQFSNINRWGINTNGLPFLKKEKLAMLIESPLQRVTIGLDSVKLGERSKPSSPIGIEGQKLFQDLVVPLAQSWKGQPDREIKLNVVYTGDEERVLGVVNSGYQLGVGVNVIEVNGVMGTKHETRLAFLNLIKKISGLFQLEPKYYSPLNQVYLYERSTTSQSNATPPVKFFQDHCADLDCGNCRKIHMRVIPTQEGLAAVPCFLQTQGDTIPLTSDGQIDAQKFAQSILYLGIGPDWQTKFQQNEL